MGLLYTVELKEFCCGSILYIKIIRVEYLTLVIPHTNSLEICGYPITPKTQSHAKTILERSYSFSITNSYQACRFRNLEMR